jgi:hypothetical protein
MLPFQEIRQPPRFLRRKSAAVSLESAVRTLKLETNWVRMTLM